MIFFNIVQNKVKINPFEPIPNTVDIHFAH
jgi:hypothetical protein